MVFFLFLSIREYFKMKVYCRQKSAPLLQKGERSPATMAALFLRSGPVLLHLVQQFDEYQLLGWRQHAQYALCHCVPFLQETRNGLLAALGQHHLKAAAVLRVEHRSEEHTSELQSRR